MKIINILERFVRLYKKPHIPGSADAIFVKESEEYIKQKIGNICNKLNLRFNKQGFGLRKQDKKSGNTYKNCILCRISTYYEGNKNVYFNLFTCFHDDGNIVVKIDRNQIKLEKDLKVYRGSKNEKEYTNNLNKSVGAIAKSFRINYKESDNTLLLTNELTDDEIFDFIEKRLSFLKPIYEELCEHGSESLFGGTLVKLFVPTTSFPSVSTFNETVVNDIDSASYMNGTIPNLARGVVGPRNKAKEELLNSELGKNGENVISEKLNEKLGKNLIKSYSWVSGNSGNKNANDSLGYDFEITNNDGSLDYYEVKTSSIDNNFNITLSLNEFSVMHKIICEKKCRYFIVIVNMNKKTIFYINSKILVEKKLLTPSEYKFKFNLNSIH